MWSFAPCLFPSTPKRRSCQASVPAVVSRPPDGCGTSVTLPRPTFAETPSRNCVYWQESNEHAYDINLSELPARYHSCHITFAMPQRSSARTAAWIDCLDRCGPEKRGCCSCPCHAYIVCSNSNVCQNQQCEIAGAALVHRRDACPCASTLYFADLRQPGARSVPWPECFGVSLSTPWSIKVHGSSTSHPIV